VNSAPQAFDQCGFSGIIRSSAIGGSPRTMQLDIRPNPEGFVAEILGADVSRFGPREDAEFHRAYLHHSVLVVRDQHLSVEEHIAFSERFGPLLQLPKKPGIDHCVAAPEIDEISNIGPDGQIAPPESDNQKFKAGNQLWHTDGSFRPAPASTSLLLCHEAVSEGGGTEFADMTGAYEALPAHRKAMLEGLLAEHSLLRSRTLLGLDEDDVTDEMRERFPPTLQPIVRVHPETGRKGLFLSQDAYRVCGMSDEASEELLSELIAFATQPRFVYRHHWHPGDLVIWDNRCTMHRGLAFEARRERRVMHRTTAMCTRPTVVDGKIAVGA
jgi:alpha-ketoglutarate-dependent 2,4-dichlorophenoxyacetate dioxygenase